MAAQKPRGLRLSYARLHSARATVGITPRPGALPDRGLGKGVKKGRIWAYVWDQQPWAGASPPGAVYTFASDWKEEHVHRHLGNTLGILLADVYKGYTKLYGPDPDRTPRLREAACRVDGIVTEPRPSQIWTCGFPASGSSWSSFAQARLH